MGAMWIVDCQAGTTGEPPHTILIMLQIFTKRLLCAVSVGIVLCVPARALRQPLNGLCAFAIT